MKTISIPFTMRVGVGDVEIEEVVVGTISVNLYDDPTDDEIDSWAGGTLQQIRGDLPYRAFAEIEQTALEEARRLHQKEIDDAKIAAQ